MSCLVSNTGLPHNALAYEELDSYEAVKDIVIKFLEENVGCFSFFRHAQVQKHGHF